MIIMEKAEKHTEFYYSNLKPGSISSLDFLHKNNHQTVLGTGNTFNYIQYN